MGAFKSAKIIGEFVECSHKMLGKLKIPNNFQIWETRMRQGPVKHHVQQARSTRERASMMCLHVPESKARPIGVKHDTQARCHAVLLFVRALQLSGLQKHERIFSFLAAMNVNHQMAVAKESVSSPLLSINFSIILNIMLIHYYAEINSNSNKSYSHFYKQQQENPLPECLITQRSNFS